jgi:pimeloyl-ACP methyl ester carboxylesterase
MTSPAPPEDRWVTTPAGRLFTRTWHPAPATDAPAIVLLHDSLGCVELWRDFPAQLAHATGRPVVAYDRLGFGRSDARTGRPSLDFVAEEAAHHFGPLLDQLGLARFVACGHSVGGGMAIECAARFASRCEALVTIAAQVFPEDRTLDGIRAARAQFREPAQVERLSRYHGDKAGWVLDAWIGCWLDPGFAAWTLTGVLPQVRCPVLAIHGEHDEYGSTVHPRLIAAHGGGPVDTSIMADTRHGPHRERPEAVLARMAAFLKAAG